MEEQEKSIQDYLVAIRKRKVAIFSVSIVVFLLTVAVALLLPAIYKSSSTILIEQQEIPSELVMSTVTTYASERIQTIQARVMTRTNLLKIIEKFDLYEDERKFATNQEIVNRIRDDVSLDVINADVVDPRTGRPSSATIAFSLSYKGESPSKVQRVTNELTSLYLNENLSSRTQEAANTSEFLKEEAERLGKQISEQEKRMALFKQKHAKSLPELKDLNLGILQRKETELVTIDVRLRALEERVIYLTSQLAQIDPGNPDVPGAVERLKTLQAAYASARSKYSDEHPDVLRLKNEIESLKGEAGQSSSAKVLAEELKVLNAELAQKKAKYTKDHPDIIALEEKIDALNTELTNAKLNPVDSYYNSKPDNPTYVTLESQLSSAESEINSIKIQRKEIQKKISELEKSLFETPQVEREYRNILRDYTNTVTRYQETKAKQMRADVAEQLESESKGERFTLIEPAAMPEKPVSPNRPAIIFIGLVLALGSGLGFALIADAISGSVRGANSIRRSLGVLPLSVIPYEMNLQDRAKSRRVKKRVVILFVAIIVFALLFIHFVVSPLDVLWFRILRKIDILMA